MQLTDRRAVADLVHGQRSGFHRVRRISVAIIRRGNLLKRGGLRERLDLVVRRWPLGRVVAAILAGVLTWMGQTVRVPVAGLVPVRIVRAGTTWSDHDPISAPVAVVRVRMVVVQRVWTMLLHCGHTDVPPHLASTFLVTLHGTDSHTSSASSTERSVTPAWCSELHRFFLTLTTLLKFEQFDKTHDDAIYPDLQHLNNVRVRKLEKSPLKQQRNLNSYIYQRERAPTLIKVGDLISTSPVLSD